MTASWIEVAGYVGTALIAGSFLAGSMLLLRALNVAGSSIFVFYGLATHSNPIVLLNAFICIVNLVQIARLVRKKDRPQEIS